MLLSNASIANCKEEEKIQQRCELMLAAPTNCCTSFPPFRTGAKASLWYIMKCFGWCFFNETISKPGRRSSHLAACRMATFSIQHPSVLMVIWKSIASWLPTINHTCHDDAVTLMSGMPWAKTFVFKWWVHSDNWLYGIHQSAKCSSTGVSAVYYVVLSVCSHSDSLWPDVMRALCRHTNDERVYFLRFLICQDSQRLTLRPWPEKLRIWMRTCWSSRNVSRPNLDSKPRNSCLHKNLSWAWYAGGQVAAVQKMIFY